MRWISCAVLCACAPSASVPCHDEIAPGDLVITEVFARYKPPAGESGGDRGRQWFELYNASERPLQLAGLELVADGGKHHVVQLALAPHAYATLGDVDPGALAPYLDYGYGDDLGTLADAGSGTLSLRCGPTEIAAITYGDARPGRSRELTAAAPPTAALAADPASWCDAATMFEPANLGTPRVASDCIPPTQCRDGNVVRAIAAPRAGDLAITEVMPSPTKVADATGEWFELHALADADLAGVALDRVRDTRTPEVIASQDCLHVAAGAYVVIARSADPAANGGLPAPIATFDFALVAGTDAAPGDVRVLAGDTVIDAVTWTGARDGAALQRDDTRWCDATTPYGDGDSGTPGAPNPACP